MAGSLSDEGRQASSRPRTTNRSVGQPITVSVTAADVIHGFWIPNFGGKIDMIRDGSTVSTSRRAARHRGVCAEFCGDQHARMAFDVLALEPAFDSWRSAQAKPARTTVRFSTRA